MKLTTKKKGKAEIEEDNLSEDMKTEPEVEKNIMIVKDNLSEEINLTEDMKSEPKDMKT